MSMIVCSTGSPQGTEVSPLPSPPLPSSSPPLLLSPLLLQRSRQSPMWRSVWSSSSLGSGACGPLFKVIAPPGGPWAGRPTWWGSARRLALDELLDGSGPAERTEDGVQVKESPAAEQKTEALEDFLAVLFGFSQEEHQSQSVLRQLSWVHLHSGRYRTM